MQKKYKVSGVWRTGIPKRMRHQPAAEDAEDDFAEFPWFTGAKNTSVYAQQCCSEKEGAMTNQDKCLAAADLANIIESDPEWFSCEFDDQLLIDALRFYAAENRPAQRDGDA